MADTRKPRQKTNKGIVLGLLTQLQTGDSFIADADVKQAQSYACKAGIKVETKICLLIEDYGSDEPKTTRVTKITIV